MQVVLPMTSQIPKKLSHGFLILIQIPWERHLAAPMESSLTSFSGRIRPQHREAHVYPQPELERAPEEER